jgi:plastocyanin
MKFATIMLVCACLAGATACGSNDYDTPTPTGPGQTPIATGPNVVLVPAGTAGNGSTPGYSPTPLTVAVGTTVTWGNNDGAQHTATSDSNLWNVSLAPGATGSFKFDTPGTYTYHCAIHSFMKGTIIVQ